MSRNRRAGRIIGRITGEDGRRYSLIYRQGQDIACRAPDGEEHEGCIGQMSSAAEARASAQMAWGRGWSLELRE